MSAWFVTGTDTGVGKTLVAQALLHRLAADHARVVGMKPVAAGAERSADGRWTNEDVLALQDASTVELPREWTNPVLLRDPVSPHIAAQREGRVIEIASILHALTRLRNAADAVVVEGAGGFRVPLGDAQDGADLAVALGLPLILVVGLRLGCLNHALLSAESIAARGLRLAGWVANHIDPDMAEPDANIALLRRRLPAPCLGELPFQQPPDARASAARLRLPDPTP
ncbi:MAG TPA: dethiobiotin synthase [Albitalea sp.]|uniref:dethiobiotin synthase n=1 Tax=Piscinibacter sp. TaxID=1903157 RepID=UPI002ED401ED